MTFSPKAGPKERKQTKRANGVSPLSYMGVLPESPINFVTFTRAPLTTDYKGWEIGDEWLDRTSTYTYKLVKKTAGINGADGTGTWARITGGIVSSLIDDIGNKVTVDADGSITVQGGTNINTANPADSIISINLDQGTSSGEVLIANSTTGIAEWNTLTAGANITITNDDGAVTIASSAGAGGDITFDCDTDTATSDAGTIEVVGTAGRIKTSGDAIAPAPGTPGTVTLDIGADVALLTDLLSFADIYTGDDASTATPVEGIINIVADNATLGCGSSVLFTATGTTVSLNVTDSDDNTFIGSLAGDLALTGINNTAVGESSLSAITSGSRNIALGGESLRYLTEGSKNVSVGAFACQAVTTGSNNTVLGDGALSALVASDDNVAVGESCLFSCIDGSKNAAVGSNSLQLCTGSSNSTLGYYTGSVLLEGDYNILIGHNAGISLTSTESSNILIGSPGIAAESNTIRIGVTGTGVKEQDTCYIAGIYDETLTSVNSKTVIIDEFGRLGTTNSDVTEDFVTDSGTAQPSGETLNVLGGQNVNTAGTGSTVTVNLNDTYQEAVDAGSLEIGVADNTEKLGTISIAALKVLLGCP